MKSICHIFCLTLAILTFHLPASANIAQPTPHHPIFEKFPDVPPQGFSEEYFEWIDLLEAVLDAEGSFTMVEVGAGFGRWGARGGVAARYCNLPFFLTLVEAEPHRCHVEIHKEMEIHGIQSHEYNIVPAAVGKTESSIFFYISTIDGKLDLDSWYGQCVMLPKDRIVGWTNETHYGQRIGLTAYNYKAVEVKQMRLNTILNQIDSPVIDLCDFDVQGHEYDVIVEAVDIINARVKRLHIGTHSHAIEQNLRVFLKKNGWELLNDYSTGQVNQTEYGAIEFVDGVQSWVNSRFN